MYLKKLKLEQIFTKFAIVVFLLKLFFYLLVIYGFLGWVYDLVIKKLKIENALNQ